MRAQCYLTRGASGATLSDSAAVTGVATRFCPTSSTTSFTSTGTFSAVRAGYADAFILGGGGSGGQRHAGGAGAGGLVYAGNMAISAGSFAVVVGAGGASVNSVPTCGSPCHSPGWTGGNSSFNGQAAVGGGGGGGVGGQAPGPVAGSVDAPNVGPGEPGGSGGGGINGNVGAAGLAGQGTKGGDGSMGPFTDEASYAGTVCSSTFVRSLLFTGLANHIISC